MIPFLREVERICLSFKDIWPINYHPFDIRHYSVINYMLIEIDRLNSWRWRIFFEMVLKKQFTTFTFISFQCIVKRFNVRRHRWPFTNIINVVDITEWNLTGKKVFQLAVLFMSYNYQTLFLSINSSFQTIYNQNLTKPLYILKKVFDNKKVLNSKKVDEFFAPFSLFIIILKYCKID